MHQCCSHLLLTCHASYLRLLNKRVKSQMSVSYMQYGPIMNSGSRAHGDAAVCYRIILQVRFKSNLIDKKDLLNLFVSQNQCM